MVISHTKRYELVEFETGYVVFDKLYHESKAAYKTLRAASMKFYQLNRRAGISVPHPRGEIA